MTGFGTHFFGLQKPPSTDTDRADGHTVPAGREGKDSPAAAALRHFVVASNSRVARGFYQHKPKIPQRLSVK